MFDGYNKHDGSETRSLKPFSESKKLPEQELVGNFSIVLEEGDGSDRTGEREPIRELVFLDGRCYINGKQVRFAEAGYEVIKANKHHLLNEKQKEALVIEKTLARLKADNRL